MSLRKQLVQQIDRFCGRKEMIEKIDRCIKLISDINDRKLLNNVCIFIGQIYDNEKYDVVEATLLFEEITRVTISKLEFYSDKHGCEHLSFMSTLLQFKLDTVKGVKLFTS